MRLILGLCAFAIFPFARAQTSPGSSLSTIVPRRLQPEKHAYPQQKLADCDANAAQKQLLGRAQMTIDPQGKIAIKGYDHLGKTWKASIETSPVAACEVWQADLNGDGQRDLVIVNFGTNSSGGWDTNLSLLIYDDNGRPFPWQATGNFHVSAAGIAEIVSAGGTSTPQIIVGQREGDAFSGYWYRYNTLAVVGGRLSSIENTRWPALPSAGENVKGVQSEASQPPDALTTVDTRPANEAWPRVLSLTGNTDDDVRLHMSDGKVFAEPKISIFDLPGGERLIHFSADKADLQRLFHEKAAVLAVGSSCEQDACQPLILWGKF